MLRHELSSFKKRLKVLEEKVAKEGIILTEAQIATLEKKRHDDEAAGEITTNQWDLREILQAFYQAKLRKKLYMDLDSLQLDLDEWPVYYNEQTTH